MADKLVSTALQEVAAEGVEGCALPKLWSLLQATPAALEVHLDDHVKQVLWRCLLNVQGMSLKSSSNPSVHPSDPTIQALENAERIGLVIIASQDLRDACLGLYDIKHADTQPSQIQHSILERLAKARTAGVTQNQLGKDFKVEGNKLFYILRSLESRGLVVRRSTLVRNKDSQRGGGSIVLTNLVHLTRYAKHLTLNSHQRFEISNSSVEQSYPEDPDEGESSKGGKQLMINDDLPAMKAICDKLQQAEGKILVVSDLKLTLGYRLSAGHRAWRRLMKRLKEAGFVTIIDAKVGRKVRSCIQLLKAFNEHEFNSTGTAEADTEQQLKGPKRGQVTEQLVELSVDQQIYDMIDDGGQDGLMMMEVWKRIGLNNKRNYYRIQNMTIKHGIHFEAENHKRSTLYRLRTLNPKKAADPEDVEMPMAYSEEMQPSVGAKRAQKLPTVRKDAKKKIEELTESMVKIDVEADAGNMVITSLEHSENPPEDAEAAPQELGVSLSPPPAPANFPPASLFRIGQPYPCLTVTTTSLQRETRILERLQEEKFVVRAELHRWLESISNKTTMMDRKTLSRTLLKLQAAGKCKCVLLAMPGSTNCGRQRTSEIVCLPDVDVNPLMGVIHDRIRKFDMESRGHGVQREKASVNSVPVLNRVTRMSSKQKKMPLPPQVDAASLHANGFVPAKMARVRILHYFLWNYTSESVAESPNFGFGTPRLTDGTGYRVFALMSALQAMPLELFLQVVGSKRLIDNLADRCRQGMRICDLPEAEQAIFLENSAGGRLAWLIDILRRLKLIRVVIGHGPVVMQDKWHIGSMSISMIEASLTYAMEENIYLEQPAPQPLPSLTKESYDLNPRDRHDFTINSKESLDNYWQTLEYFFSGAEPSIARHAFPGSSVPELFGLRSWTSLRIMTVDQRNELVKRMNEGGPENRKSIQDCAKIAKELNLTLEQVLRISYEKNRRVRLQTLQKGEPSFMLAFASHNFSQGENAGDGDALREDIGQMFITPVAESSHMEKDTEGDDGEDSVNHISIVTKLKPSRSRRFPWSDKLDRVLFYAYAKQRALMGAKINRVDWNSIQCLPAGPVVCRRRMSILKADMSVKKAILNLCSLLAVRYERYCQLIENVEDQAAPRADPEEVEGADIFSVTPLQEQPEYYWDNPDDPSVVAAVDEIIRCKNLSRSCYNKPCHNRRVTGTTASTSSTFEPLEADVHLDPAQLSSAAGLMQSKRQGAKPAGKPRSRRTRKKVKTKPASLKTLSTEELVQQSVGIPNAIEFIKLVFLNSSVNNDDVQLPKSFMDALHQFKESYVFTAFNYLRENNMVASGQGTQSFVLSETFTQNVSSSRFPNSTAEEALAALKWLQERKSEIDQDWVRYNIEDHCGQLLHLFAKISSGELLLAPKVPNVGIGESDDPRSIGCGLKRKSENQEQNTRTVKARLENQDEVYQAVRRERGFPGIDVLLHRQALSLPDLLTDASNFDTEFVNEGPSSVMEHFSQPEASFATDAPDVSSAMEEDSTSLNPELLDAVAREVENAGEEGLSMKQLAESLALPNRQAECYAEALESAGQANLVNAFDHVRVLAKAHAAPYFLQFSRKKTDQRYISEKAKGKASVEQAAAATSPSAMETDAPDLSEVSNTLPILPWLTSHGTVNTKIFKGLVRRVLGIVTLNPGIPEEELVKRMQVLNPQTAKHLLSMLQLDGKLTVRKSMYSSPSPPTMLTESGGSGGFVEQLHYYANPRCAFSL